MGDQVIGIYVVPAIAQVLVPLALLMWQGFGPVKSRAGWLFRAAAAGSYLIAITIVGLWLVVPWYAAVVYLLALITLIFARRIGQIPRWPRESRGWIGIALSSGLAICSIGLVLVGLSGRWPPREDVVGLVFPLQHGTYYIVGGGSNELINPHLQTLTAERFRNYRGESYAIDIVQVNGIGMRATNLGPRDPRKYVIFGTGVFAPCSGRVLRAEDGFPDMPPPRPDRSHLAGNYVFLDCGGSNILLAHFQQGTVRVRPDESVSVGTVLGQVGNSGNTGEPHLHIHAQRPAENAEFLSGDPLPVRFDGRFLVRNDWVRQNVGLFAPPVGGLFALLGLFILSLLYLFRIRSWFWKADVTIGRSVKANPHERRRTLPGDDFIAEPIGSFTHAITIQGPPDKVWPWLAQMGAGSRAGWYSYDSVDNGTQPSAEWIVPELQDIAVGMLFPALPGVTDGFILVTFEPERFLVIGWPSRDGSWIMTWAFVLEPKDGGTRLIVRARGAHDYHFHRMPWWLAKRIVPLIHAIMERKQLLGIARRVEQPEVARVLLETTEAA